MEIEAGMAAAARHHVENVLSALAFGISTNDAALVAELLNGVRVQLDDAADLGEAGFDSFIQWAARGRTAVVQAVTNVNVQLMNNSIRYMAVYQNWVMEPEPACFSSGTYVGRLVAGPQVWRWVEHRASTIEALPVRNVRGASLTAIR